MNTQKMVLYALLKQNILLLFLLFYLLVVTIWMPTG